MGSSDLSRSRFDSFHSPMAFGLLNNVECPERSRRIYNLFMSYFVYILRTSSNTLYIGQTNNLKKRIKEHKSKSLRSAKYIRYFSSFKLVYKESHRLRKEAMRREAQLKKWPKSKKEALIKEDLELLKKL